LFFDRGRQADILSLALQASRSIFSSPKTLALGLHNLPDPQVLCRTGQGIPQPSMNIRLVEFNLLPLPPEMKPASDDSTEKAGHKNHDGFQHFIRPQKHFQPASASREKV